MRHNRRRSRLRGERRDRVRRSSQSDLQLTPHQQLLDGAPSLVLYLWGTDLPIMIFIYAILLPRYARLFTPHVTFLAGVVSTRLCTSSTWTRCDAPCHPAVSVIVILLTFFPRGLSSHFSYSAQEMPGSICGLPRHHSISHGLALRRFCKS
jgi:hypothetical protein